MGGVEIKIKEHLYVPVLLLAVALCLLVLQRERTIETPYDYPIRPGTEEWAKFESRREMELGFWHIAKEFNGMQEFMTREDALSALKAYGAFQDLTSDDHVLTIIYRNVQREQNKE